MPNPAAVLVSYLELWQVVEAGKTIRNARSVGSSATSPEILRASELEAADMLRQVVQMIEMRPVQLGHYKVFVPDWFEAVFVPFRKWNEVLNSSGTTEIVSSQHIAALQGLSAYLDATAFQGFTPAPGSIAVARAAVEDLNDLLGSPELGLDHSLRTYLFTLLSEVRTVMDASSAEVPVDLLRRLNELRGAIDTLADQIADPTLAEKFRAAVRKVYPIAVQGALAVGWGADLTANMMQITVGPGH